MSARTEGDAAIDTLLVERVLKDHALAGERYIREKRTTADVCTCGTLHPQFDVGRWPTHRRHLAEQIVRALQRP